MLINGTTAGKSAQHKYISLIEQLGMAATMPMPVGLRGFFHRLFTDFSQKAATGVEEREEG
jgi:hypothetical protein